MRKFLLMAALLCSAAWTVAAWAGGNSFHGVEVACSRLPTGAVSLATLHYPGSGDPSACPDLCAKWVSTCKGWANAASTCLKSEASKTASLEKTACTTPACKQAVGADLEDFLDDLIANTNTAKDTCESNETACVNTCQN